MIIINYKRLNMNKTLLTFATLTLLNNTVIAEEKHSHDEDNKTTIQIQSIRGLLGNNDPIKHMRGQVRAGYIHLKEDALEKTSAYGLAGHVHFDSKKWYGLSVGASAYALLNPTQNQNRPELNADFFDADGKSFLLISEAYMHGQWGNTELKFGRQILDTPHADSDDIRLIPNYFEAYTLSNTDIKDLTLTTGLIRKMAGWENGVDSSEFAHISQTLGAESTDGIMYVAGIYDGITDVSLSLWYYHYADIANILYAEAGYTLHTSKYLDITFGLQYDASWDTGKTLLQAQDARTFGASIELVSEEIGVHVLMAYNKDNGSTGASGLSLGGGALFTSMEDQTLDAMGQAGESWVLGLGYHFEALDIEGLNAGIAYGSFQAVDASSYEVTELDAVVEYSFNERFSMVLAYADIDSKTDALTDYTQVRIVANYNF